MNIHISPELQQCADEYAKKKGKDRREKYIHFYLLACQNGVVPFRCSRIAEEYTDDYYADTGVPIKEKDWYYERGIPTFKVAWYGLTKDNYNSFISDFDFYAPRNYIKNPQLIKWYDNKLTTYYILSAFRRYMPNHYFYIQGGEIVPIEADIRRYGNIEDIFEIVDKQPLAFKACRGGHGEGFFKMAKIGNQYYLNNNKIEKSSIVQLFNSLDDYIITSYEKPCRVFRNICGENSFAVLRTVSIFDKKEGPQMTATMIRMGSKTSGIISDYDGSIYCGVDLEDGRLFKPILRKGDSEGIIKGIGIKEHPDTGCAFELITIPHFNDLKKLVKDISTHLAMTPYLVMDIIPTDSGFKILEVNSHGQVRNIEPFYPFRKNKFNLRVFDTKDW